MKDQQSAPGREVPQSATTVVDHAATDLTWSVGAVSERLGVAPSTLRTWERRYGVGPSHRTRGGHRRYTERDIERVELVRRLVRRGVSAQDAARVARNLERDELVNALSEESAREEHSIGPDDLVDAVLAATVTSDGLRLQELFGALLGGARFADAWRDVFSPVLARMAHESSVGSLELEAERLATDVMLHEIRRVRARGARPAQPQVLLVSGTDDDACLPFVALGAALVDADVTTRSVGPGAEPRAITDLVDKMRPQVLVWWEQPAGVEEPLRHQLERPDVDTFLMRAAPTWPHEIGLRFGFEPPFVATDVGGALRHVLDRVT
ncbi:MerR family transcriptional regulator [Aeromicrobium sp. CTD01-1L150]|uniref:MerR family transcriptional regulator n=1 Tax=Aeromicrobium sp. CTD01-1L150 TaxID=3341830 RepID=UPI0035BF2D3D